jgi:hypothetical protein
MNINFVNTGLLPNWFSLEYCRFQVTHDQYVFVRGYKIGQVAIIGPSAEHLNIKYSLKISFMKL